LIKNVLLPRLLQLETLIITAGYMRDLFYATNPSLNYYIASVILTGVLKAYRLPRLIIGDYRLFGSHPNIE
jgi:hypothetical protein